MLPPVPVASPAAVTAGRVLDAVAEATGAAAPAKARKPSPKKRAADAALGAIASAAAPAVGRAVSAAIRGRSAVPGYAASSPAKASSSAKGALDFLRDPKLSIEEKLMRLLAHQNEKWEKEMQAKLDQLAAGEAGGASAKPRSSSSSGALGGVAGAIGKALGVGDLAGAISGAVKIPGVRAALEKLGGPVLGAAASALGFPAAAPLLTKYGGRILGAAADAASSLAGQAATGEAGGATSTGGKAMSDAKRQQITLEIQRLYEKQKEMFSLVSSILRVSHETRSAVIGNIR